MHVKVDRSFITADQFTYRLKRCLQLTCISLSRRMADAAVVWKRFTQTFVQRAGMERARREKLAERGGPATAGPGPRRT